MAAKPAKGYEIDMCSGSILPKMLLFTLPLMCSSILQLLFNAADIVVVGRFAGDASLAAVGCTASIIALLTNLFIGLSVGANILAARHCGARADEELSHTVHTSMLLSLISGVIMTVVGIVCARPILEVMSTPEEVLDLAVLYLRVYFLGMTATMLYNFGAALLRAVGDTRRPLYYLLTAGVVNVVLNLFFVIVLDLDVAGVAAATAISQCISAALVVRCLLRDQGGVHLNPKKLHIHKVILLQILRVGVPAGFQGILFSVSNMVIQSSINSFGHIVMAGSSAAANIEQFVYFATNSFYQAAISFTSQNLGAKQYGRIRPILLRAQLCVIAVGLVLGNLVYFFGHGLLGIYSTSQAVIETGMVRLSICARNYAVCGMMDVMVGSLRGLGYSIMPMLVSLIGVCGLRLVWVATVFQIPQYHTVRVVYLSYPVSWVVTFGVHMLCFLWAMNRLRKKLAEQGERLP